MGSCAGISPRTLMTLVVDALLWSALWSTPWTCPGRSLACVALAAMVQMRMMSGAQRAVQETLRSQRCAASGSGAVASVAARAVRNEWFNLAQAVATALL